MHSNTLTLLYIPRTIQDSHAHLYVPCAIQDFHASIVLPKGRINYIRPLGHVSASGKESKKNLPSLDEKFIETFEKKR